MSKDGTVPMKWFRGYTNEAMFHLVDDDAKTKPGRPMFPGVQASQLTLSVCGRWYYADEALIEGLASHDGTPPGFYNCPTCLARWENSRECEAKACR